MGNHHFRSEIEAEFARLGLRNEDIPGGGLAFSGQDAVEDFLAHLRSLPSAATWRDVFPDLPAHWDVDDPETWTMPERCLGPFDFPEPPRGSAVFASMDIRGDVDAGEAALRGLESLGIAIHGCGVIRDRGHPHLFVVMPLGALEADLDRIADYLREQPGMANAYPYRVESRPALGT